MESTANEAVRGRESLISGPGSRVAVRVIPVEEELLLVRAALAVATLT